MIFAPMLTKQRDNLSSPSTDKTMPKKEDDFRVTGYRAAFVFDVEQTEGKPLPEFAKTTGDPKDHLEKLKALVAKQGISLEYDKSIAPAYGVSYGGKIRLVPGMQPAEEFSVLAHELAYATRWQEHGIPLRTLQAWLGHKNLETTMIYLGVTDTAKLGNEVDEAFGD